MSWKIGLVNALACVVMSYDAWNDIVHQRLGYAAVSLALALGNGLVAVYWMVRRV